MLLIVRLSVGQESLNTTIPTSRDAFQELARVSQQKIKYTQLRSNGAGERQTQAASPQWVSENPALSLSYFCGLLLILFKSEIDKLICVYHHLPPSGHTTEIKDFRGP